MIPIQYSLLEFVTTYRSGFYDHIDFSPTLSKLGNRVHSSPSTTVDIDCLTLIIDIEHMLATYWNFFSGLFEK